MSTNPSKKNSHLFFMQLALNQAKKGIGKTGQNPSVGCVIVKNNVVISSAHTGCNGRPHAESLAIKRADKNLNKSSIYITMEPCSNYGKTSPCVNAIIKSKIKKVFYSIKDPDIRSYGKAKRSFLKNKIFVNEGLLRKKVSQFYKSYFFAKNKKKSFLISKLAISNDNYSKTKKNKWITNFYSRMRGHILRSECDAILSTSTTIIDDNPNLNCRIDGLEEFSPSKFIIDQKLNIPLSANIFKQSKKIKTYIFYNLKKNTKLTFFKRNNIKCIYMNLSNKKISLELVLEKIFKLGYSRILLEGGIVINIEFLKKMLIDQFYIFQSNKNLNSNGLNPSYKILNFLKSKHNIESKYEFISNKEKIKIFNLKNV
ncbi:MAG: riboflavin biosynthesis protein RibD [Candidatus Pelagibacter sp. TMED64]|nr:riboflavin biosynthesis protein RibD [Candidatus Pelagibacter sp.]OUU67638.1 MAG: riboflavin biosynthesis protein RibD [Candidatus Pelagibacter sp. TMED64]|tara:strand:- start:26 stop:1135 length:1110 start_codon:yes stop_codon:yes gene_type:complete